MAMTEKEPQSVQPRSGTVTEHLANERTFLAWLRTAVSLISFGITINRFSLYLAELDTKNGHTQRRGLELFVDSQRFGLGLILIGTAALILAAWRYKRTYDRILRDDYRPEPWMIWATTAAVAIFGAAATIWLFQR
jgi:putative membrane protein